MCHMCDGTCVCDGHPGSSGKRCSRPESKIRPRGVCQTWKTRTPPLGSPKVQCKKSLIFLLLLKNESLAGAGLKNRIYKNE